MILRNFKKIKFLFLGLFLILNFFYFTPVLAEAEGEAQPGCCVLTVYSSNGNVSSNCNSVANASECEVGTVPFGMGGSGTTELISGSCDSVERCAPSGTPILDPGEKQPIDTSKYTPEINVEIGSTLIKFDPIDCTTGEECRVPWLGQYIGVLYKYFVGIAAILAAIMILIGGFIWLTSAGNPSRVTQAKEFIVGALTGLFLTLFSYLILYTINPNLVTFEPLVIKRVVPVKLEEIIKQYEAGGCPGQDEMKSGFKSLVTGYCKPTRSEFSSDHAFLCQVGLNCTCPSGSTGANDCGSGGKTWSSCKSFDANNTSYCNQTASGAAPQEGQIAADPCFGFGSKVCIGGKTYTVTDRGGWIKGKHFDVFSSTCAGANSVTGYYDTTMGECK